MNNNTQKAAKLLSDGNYSYALCNGNEVYTSKDMGIKPLMDLLSSNTDLYGFSAADKIVGKAAAMLYILLDVSEVYAPVMSESAKCTLEIYGISPICDKCVKEIINRQGTDICPMEKTVAEIDDPKKAYDALKAKMLKMQQMKND